MEVLEVGHLRYLGAPRGALYIYTLTVPLSTVQASPMSNTGGHGPGPPPSAPPPPTADAPSQLPWRDGGSLTAGLVAMNSLGLGGLSLMERLDSGAQGLQHMQSSLPADLLSSPKWRALLMSWEEEAAAAAAAGLTAADDMHLDTAGSNGTATTAAPPALQQAASDPAAEAHSGLPQQQYKQPKPRGGGGKKRPGEGGGGGSAEGRAPKHQRQVGPTGYNEDGGGTPSQQQAQGDQQMLDAEEGDDDLSPTDVLTGLDRVHPATVGSPPAGAAPLRRHLQATAPTAAAGRKVRAAAAATQQQQQQQQQQPVRQDSAVPMLLVPDRLLHGALSADATQLLHAASLGGAAAALTAQAQMHAAVAAAAGAMAATASGSPLASFAWAMPQQGALSAAAAAAAAPAWESGDRSPGLPAATAAAGGSAKKAQAASAGARQQLSTKSHKAVPTGECQTPPPLFHCPTGVLGRCSQSPDPAPALLRPTQAAPGCSRRATAA